MVFSRERQAREAAMVNRLLVLQARAEARAKLYAANEFDLEQALTPLLRYATKSGITDEIGGEAAFAIIRHAFKGIAEI
jgi:hypothetical protein